MEVQSFVFVTLLCTMFDQWFYLWCYFLPVWRQIAEDYFYHNYYHHHYHYFQCLYYFLAAWRQTAAEKIPDVQQASAISPPDDIVIS